MDRTDAFVDADHARALADSWQVQAGDAIAPWAPLSALEYCRPASPGDGARSNADGLVLTLDALDARIELPGHLPARRFGLLRTIRALPPIALDQARCLGGFSIGDQQRPERSSTYWSLFDLDAQPEAMRDWLAAYLAGWETAVALGATPADDAVRWKLTLHIPERHCECGSFGIPLHLPDLPALAALIDGLSEPGPAELQPLLTEAGQAPQALLGDRCWLQGGGLIVDSRTLDIRDEVAMQQISTLDGDALDTALDAFPSFSVRARLDRAALIEPLRTAQRMLLALQSRFGAFAPTVFTGQRT